jgi:hypothetical protein
MLLPVLAGTLPAIEFLLDVQSPAELEVEIRRSAVLGNFTPDVAVARHLLELAPGRAQKLKIESTAKLDHAQYVFYCLRPHRAIELHTSGLRITGVLSLSQSRNAAVAKSSKQEPPSDSGIDTFEFWLPSRRPAGRNLAISIDPPLDVFRPENVVAGPARPTTQPNAWVADPRDPSPVLTLEWPEKQRIGCIQLSFDTDFDHPLESVLMGHPEREIPFCIKAYRIRDDQGKTLFECASNHQTRNTITLTPAVETSALHIDVLATHGAPAAIFELRCYR